MSQEKIFIRTVFFALPLALLLSFPAMAQTNVSPTGVPLGTTTTTTPPASGYSGYSSGNTGTSAAPLDAPQPVMPAPTSLPLYSGPQGGYGAAPAAPVIDPAAAAHQQGTQPPQATATAGAPAAAPPPDPCAAYMASYESYVVCQDRMLKIQRMKDAKAKRAAPAPAATPAAAPAAPMDPAAAAAAAAVTAIQNATAPKQQKGVSFYK